jgi:hypothetical protein
MGQPRQKRLGDINVFESGDYYLIKGKKRKASSKFLYYNWSERKYQLGKKGLTLGKVVHNNKVIDGYFSIKYPVYIDEENTLYQDLAVVIANDCEVTARIGPSNYRVAKKLKISAYNSDQSLFNYNAYDLNLYGAANNRAFITSTKRYNQNKKIKDQFADLFAPYSYGVELETSSGKPANYLLEEFCLTPVKDGSIDGYEFITVPLSCQNVGSQLINIADALKFLCGVDNSCSLHVHMGNLPAPRRLLIPLYVLLYRLQNELHEMMPMYKKSLKYLVNKKGGAKDHCQYLPNLGFQMGPGENLEKNILTFFTEGEISSFDDLAAGKKYSKLEQQKWNVHKRYYFVNMLGYLFGGTIEFRLHPGTLNKYRIIYWMLICTALIKFALVKPKRCTSNTSKITLTDVIKEVYKVSNSAVYYTLIEYITNCKASYIKDSQNDDYHGMKYFNEDKLFKFNPLNLNFNSIFNND